MKTTHTKPPVEILDFLHYCELKGIEIPESVDNWWFGETELNERNKENHD
jgi:hypothetical protein